MPTSVTLVNDNVPDYAGHAELYRIVGTDNYIIVSAINHYVCETFIFAADCSGQVIDWDELPGSIRGVADCRLALEQGGYIIINDDTIIEGEAIIIAGELTI